MRAPSRLNFWGGWPYCFAMAAFCWRFFSSWSARAAWPSGIGASADTILAVVCRLGAAILTRKLAAESISMAGQCCDSIIFFNDGLVVHVQVMPGNIAMAVTPSGLCMVYFRPAPLEWQPGSRAMLPANFQLLGTSSV